MIVTLLLFFLFCFFSFLQLKIFKKRLSRNVYLVFGPVSGIMTNFVSWLKTIKTRSSSVPLILYRPSTRLQNMLQPNLNEFFQRA